jgi:hypothetical protein
VLGQDELLLDNDYLRHVLAGNKKALMIGDDMETNGHD